MLLMEDMDHYIQPDAAVATVQKMQPVDLIMGNWDPVEGASDVTKLLSKNKGAFFMTGTEIVRLSLDRALGCVYPEDRTKQDKTIIDFEAENLGLLKKTLEEHFRWCYASISDEKFVEMTMDMLNQSRLDQLKRLLTSCPKLPWEDSKEHNDLWAIIEARIKRIREFLPYHEIIPSTKSIPLARDGHGAVAINGDGDTKMFICGGNSEKGPLKDFWEFNFGCNSWTRLEDMPSSGCYSFSMHLFLRRYVILYGGCMNQGKTMRVHGEISWYDIQERKWHQHRSGEGQAKPEARCRHGSYFRDIDEMSGEMTVIGGTGQDNKKRDDVWKLLVQQPQPGMLTFEWTQGAKASKKTQRCFLFAHNNSFYLLGGFGRNLRNLEKLSNGRQSMVVTRTSNLPPSEKQSFAETKSLAGFGAVYDSIEERVIMIGGGNVTSCKGLESPLKKDKAFGGIPEDKKVSSKPRILILQHMKNEWKWVQKEPYSSLDEKYKLPNLLHWTLVYIDHSVILFGGRSGDSWSNKLYKLNLRPELNQDIQQTTEDFEVFQEKLSKRCRKYDGKELEEMKEKIREQLDDLQSSYQ